jgi:hypothetical protein
MSEVKFGESPEQNNISKEARRLYREQISVQIQSLLERKVDLAQVAKILGAEDFIEVRSKPGGDYFHFKVLEFFEKEEREGNSLNFPTDYEHLNSTIVPPDPGRMSLNKGEGHEFKRDKIFRTRALIDLLSQENLPYRIGDGENKPEMLRGEGYTAIIVDSIHKLFLVNDESGNATFIVYDLEEDKGSWKNYAGLSKSQLEGLGPDKVKTVYFTGDLGSWQEKLAKYLYENPVPKEKWENYARGYLSLDKLIERSKSYGLEPTSHTPGMFKDSSGDFWITPTLADNLDLRREAKSYSGKTLPGPSVRNAELEIELYPLSSLRKSKEELESLPIADANGIVVVNNEEYAIIKNLRTLYRVNYSKLKPALTGPETLRVKSRDGKEVVAYKLADIQRRCEELKIRLREADANLKEVNPEGLVTFERGTKYALFSYFLKHFEKSALPISRNIAVQLFRENSVPQAFARMSIGTRFKVPVYELASGLRSLENFLELPVVNDDGISMKEGAPWVTFEWIVKTYFPKGNITPKAREELKALKNQRIRVRYKNWNRRTYAYPKSDIEKIFEHK